MQKLNEQRLESYLDLLELTLCKRCWRESNDKGKPYHHHGGLLQILESSKLDRLSIDSWRADTEHGFCHGFVTSFFATYLSHQMSKFRKEISTDGSMWSVSQGIEVVGSKHKAYNAENFIVACLFHDLLKCLGSDKDHDVRLKEIFNGFDKEVYTHSNPTDNKHPLVGADRMELMRFEDHDQWVDRSRLEPYLDVYGHEAAFHFYKHIRPIIKKITMDLDDVWFSHVEEKASSDQTVIRSTGFPWNHWRAVDHSFAPNEDIDLYFSVNSGFLPFERCLSHTKKGLTGLISKCQIRRLGVKVAAAPASTWGRDHFFLKHHGIPEDEWIFLYHEKAVPFHTIKIELFNKLVRVCKNLIAKLIAIV